MVVPEFSCICEKTEVAGMVDAPRACLWFSTEESLLGRVLPLAWDSGEVKRTCLFEYLPFLFASPLTVPLKISLFAAFLSRSCLKGSLLVREVL